MTLRNNDILNLMKFFLEIKKTPKRSLPVKLSYAVLKNFNALSAPYQEITKKIFELKDAEKSEVEAFLNERRSIEIFKVSLSDIENGDLTFDEVEIITAFMLKE